MQLQEQLVADMKSAMKSGQKDRLAVIRMLLSDVKNIDLLPGKPTAESVVAAYRKKLQKSSEEYEKLGRPDEVTKLKAEMAIVDEYLPTKASAEQTTALVEAFLASHPFAASQVGQAIGAFMKAHGQSVDAAIASQLIRQKL
ncbi:MAG: GatB/YqeY domain-containing protein [Phycisphaerales bacterium]|nr:GatB/YqeY domain-containing protein [Phycisphaerales bacterium]